MGHQEVDEPYIINKTEFRQREEVEKTVGGSGGGVPCLDPKYKRLTCVTAESEMLVREIHLMGGPMDSFFYSTSPFLCQRTHTANRLIVQPLVCSPSKLFLK